MGRTAWGDWCDMNGGGVRDPAKHPASFVQRFLDAYQRGELRAREDGFGSEGLARVGYSDQQPRDNTQLISLLKEGQRRSQHWKYAWSGYCQQYGGGINDPSKHKPQFLVSFLDFLGQSGTIHADGSLAAFTQGASMPAASSPQGGGMQMGYGSGGGGCGYSADPWDGSGQLAGQSAGQLPGAKRLMMPGGWSADPWDGSGQLAGQPPGQLPGTKRMRPMMPGSAPGPYAGGPQQYGGSTSGDPEKDRLVAQVKTYQRQGDLQRGVWQSYCDEHLGGVRDPARHKKEVLQMFMQHSQARAALQQGQQHQY